jgi:hypothetical protein
MSGDDMAAAFREVYATPPALIARLAAASTEKPDLKVLESTGAKDSD